MTMNEFDQLAELIYRERHSVLSQWRQQVRDLPSAQHLDTPTLNDHIPGFLEELVAAFQSMSDQTIPEALSEGSPPAHGLQRVEDGFDLVEVVAEYNILRGCIHDLVDNNGLSLQGRPFHTMNRVFDQAIGLAVETFSTQRAVEVQRRREEYLAFVAHDLRTPLNAISLAASLLELTFPSAGETAEMPQIFSILRRNVQNLEGLVHKVLEENTNLLTEMGVKLERREFDLWPLIEALIHDLHPVAGTDSTALINKVPVNLVVYADASLLRRVFQNLIANAISYTPRGEVIIGAMQTSDGGAVECFVRDNGVGIPADRCRSVFDKHETDPDKDGGLGLGLAIVKTFIEAHDGKVNVESDLGVGSTFRLTLPGRGR